jgi:hypothetical protein
MESFGNFLEWEKASRDTIDVKRCYIDLAGDLVSGVFLSQLIYWHLPTKQGVKLRVQRDGAMWIAKSLDEWWGECRVTRKQAMRCINDLEERGLIEKRNWRFNGLRMMHLRIVPGAFLKGLSAVLKGTAKVTSEDSRKYPEVTTESDLRVLPLTESTTETTTKKSSEPNGSTPNGHQNDKKKKLETIKKINPKGKTFQPMTPRKTGDLLAIATERAFIENNPYWEQPGRERKNVNEIVEKAHIMWNGDAEEWIKAILATVLRLKQEDTSSKGFWRSMPFLPSQVNSSGKWPMIVEETKALMDEAAEPVTKFDLNA